MLLTERRLRESIQRILLEVDEAKVQMKLEKIAKYWKEIQENEPFADKEDPEILFQTGKLLHGFFNQISNFPDSREIAKKYDKRRKDKSYLQRLKALKGKTKEHRKPSAWDKRGQSLKFKMQCNKVAVVVKRLIGDIKADKDILEILQRAEEITK